MATHGLLVASRDARVAQMLERLAACDGIEALVALSGELRELAFELLEGAESAARLTRTVADLNDALTIRMLDLIRKRHDLSGVRLAWLALGSEGRREQTVHTDQDNALIFEADAGAPSAVRQIGRADDGNPVPEGAVQRRNTVVLSPGETYDITFTAGAAPAAPRCTRRSRTR